MKSLVFRSLQHFAKYAKQPRMALVSTKNYDVEYFNKINAERPKDKQIHITYFNDILNKDFAKTLKGFDIVCPFVNDKLDAPCLEQLKQVGVDLIALRCAGFNNVDLNKAKSLGFGVVRVPAYSPQAVAEHALALIQTLNRRTHRAYNRVRSSNFSIEGFIGFDLYRKTAGIVGMGKIGQAFAAICQGLGMNIIVYDPITPSQSLLDKFGAKSVDLNTLFSQSDVLSLHCPLTPETKHIVQKANIELMKPKSLIINTGRGGLVNAKDAIWALKNKRIGGLGIDVYEHESGLFFNDLNNEIVVDDDLMRLTTFPNVVITAHQAFLTEEALTSISNVTLDNIFEYRTTGKCTNSVI